ncbi:MAG TPA: class I SAM-dependent methyltransferase [Candidatus Angelobacter sp.]
MGATVNKKYYDTLNGEAAVLTQRVLFPAEETILSSVKESIRDKAILEIGAGAGRVTPHLRALTRHYVGFDYSPAMIAAAKALYPDAPLFIHDATDMSAFKTGEFDAIFFCWNGIDEIKLSDRARILQEVHRLLKADGIFVFSSHNLEWSFIPAYVFPEFAYSSSLFIYVLDSFLGLVAYAVTALKYLFSKLTSKGQTALWEYENSPKKLLVPRIYIRPEAQIRQLYLAGFQQVEAIASDGTALTDKNYDEDFFVYYVAKKGKVTIISSIRY